MSLSQRRNGITAKSALPNGLNINFIQSWFGALTAQRTNKMGLCQFPPNTMKTRMEFSSNKVDLSTEMYEFFKSEEQQGRMGDKKRIFYRFGNGAA